MSGVTIETHEGDLTGLTGADIAGTSLVTASALLDLLTADEVDALAGACVEAGCPALFTLSVAGRVEFDPAESLDAEFEAAFNGHQRRVVGGRRLLGPDAVAVTAAALGRWADRARARGLNAEVTDPDGDPASDRRLQVGRSGPAAGGGLSVRDSTYASQLEIIAGTGCHRG